ncbi:MAG: hypothetical protein M0Z55_09915 [Peptococcaceae bacterium]|nr:hypothetical protein [Peptococcaceae bacterium]
MLTRLIKLVKTRESGYALPLVLISIVVFAVIGTTYLGIISNEQKVSNDLVNQWQAKYLAEAGVEDALFQLKVSAQNNNQAYTNDLTAHSFGSDGNYLLPNIVSGTTGSLGQGTLKGPGNTILGTYKWVITYNSTTPATPVVVLPEQLTNNLTVESVGTLEERATNGNLMYDSSGNPITRQFRVRESVGVTFEPPLIPDTPVQITIYSYTEVPGKFSWE